MSFSHLKVCNDVVYVDDLAVLVSFDVLLLLSCLEANIFFTSVDLNVIGQMIQRVHYPCTGVYPELCSIP